MSYVSGGKGAGGCLRLKIGGQPQRLRRRRRRRELRGVGQPVETGGRSFCLGRAKATSEGNESEVSCGEMV